MINSNARRPNHGGPHRFVSHGQRHGASIAPGYADRLTRDPGGKLQPMEPEPLARSWEPGPIAGSLILCAFALLFWAVWVMLP